MTAPNTPMYPGTFTGWKGLLANEEGRLWSPQHGDFEWPSFKRAEAECNKSHAPGSAGCSCGIYAVKSLEALLDSGYNWEPPRERRDRGLCITVIAKLNMWGEMQKGSIGFRAPYAYPEKIYVGGLAGLKFSGAIRRRYGVTVTVIDRFTGRTLDREEQ